MTSPVLCLTPNPAVDRTLIVPDFTPGAIFRPERTIVDAGGKGLNVARALHILGRPSMAAGLIGGHMGRLLADALARRDIPADWTWFTGETRACTIIVDGQNRSTVLNETTVITEADWERFRADAVRAARTAALVCISGSMPQGAPPDAPGDLIALLRETERPVWVDTSGRALTSAASARPTAIKVNGDEAGVLAGQTVDDARSAVRAARALHERGIATVALTLGRDGAVLVDKTGAYAGAPPAVKVVSPVASGDAFLAGIVHALLDGADSADALRAGIAAGTANAMFAGGAVFTPESFRDVLARTRVERVR